MGTSPANGVSFIAMFDYRRVYMITYTYTDTDRNSVGVSVCEVTWLYYSHPIIVNEKEQKQMENQKAKLLCVCE